MKLLENWVHLWWRRWSTWLAAVNGLLVTYVFSQPILVVGLLGFTPGEWLIPFAIILGVLAFGLPVLISLINQPKMRAKIDKITEEKANAE